MKVLQRPRSLRWHLVFLGFATIAPFIVFFTILVNQLVLRERQAAEQRFITSSQQLARSIDQEFQGYVRTLEALSVAHAIQNGNYEAFHQSLLNAVKHQKGWENIVLHSPNTETFMSAILKYGEPLVRSVELESVRNVFETGKPVVSYVFKGPAGSVLADRFGFAIRVPVFVKGKIKFTISAVVSSESFREVVERFSPSSKDEWTRTIIDARGIVAARSRTPEKFLGVDVGEPFQKLLIEKTGQLIRTPSMEGVDVYVSHSRSPFSGWTAMVSVPVEVLEAPAMRARSLVLGSGFLLLLVFGTFAALYARKLTKHIRNVSQEAVALAEGGQIQSRSTSNIVEVEKLHESMMIAERLLESREKERNEHLLRATATKAEAERANQAKSEFLANMSHELRSPLGIILGFLNLLEKSEVTEEERVSLQARVKRNAEYLLSLIDQILDLSKVEANALETEVSAVPIRYLIHEVCDDLNTLAASKGIFLKIEVKDNVPEVIYSDPLRVRQILVNVVGNAVKFTNSGGVTVTVSPSNSNFVEFLVEDTGIGITENQMNRLFTPFSQADSSMSRRFGGTGLGLSLSKRVAKALGGDVQILKSVEGRGSTFLVRIKNDDSAAARTRDGFFDGKLMDGKSETAKSRRPLEGINILLADDSNDNRFLVRRFLSSVGAEVSEASNGREALDTALSKNFDCVLMDIQMPVMDGNQATTELRKRGYAKPILAITAHAMKTEREQALRLGYSDYLTKPIDEERLVEIILNLIRPGG
jgi:signal transduction histidine kinase/CheY-like chemotaxis protein